MCSTPLLTTGGELIGTIATYFPRPHRPTDRETRLVELYARQAAEFIDNARLYREIREADRHKDEFLAMLAHELRNPLAPLLNALHILRTGRLDGQEAEQARDIAERQVRHLARLVDDLLDVSRISSGKIQLRKGPVDLRAAVARAVETARPLIEARRHELSVSLPEEPVPAGGRRGPAGAGPRQPAEQRRQVHRAGGPDRAGGRARGGRGVRSGPGHRHRDRPGAAARASSTCSPRRSGRWTGARGGWGSA